MQYLIKLKGLIVTSIFCLITLCCSQNNNEMEFIIEGNIVDAGYKYNPFGFIDSPYGRVTIVTNSSFEDGRLVNLSWNRANGALDYSLEDLKNDPKLYRSFNVDSMFSENKKRLVDYSENIVRNDTIFLKKQDRIIILKTKIIL